MIVLRLGELQLHQDAVHVFLDGALGHRETGLCSMPALEYPSAMSESVSRSRGVSASSGSFLLRAVTSPGSSSGPRPILLSCDA